MKKKKKKSKPRVSTPFSRAKTLAVQASRDPKKLTRVLSQALRQANKLPKGEHYKWENLFLMIRLVKAYQKKKYTKLSKRNLHLILSAIVYFVSPDDWIPDDTEFGLLDDAIIVNSVAAAVAGDLEDFLSWEKKKKK